VSWLSWARKRSICILVRSSSPLASVIGLSSAFCLPLVPSVERWLALALEIVDRVLEQHAALVEEPVEVVPGREVQQVAELVCSNPVGSVRVDRERLERDFDRSRSWVADDGGLRLAS
jgi:hypothetical protein